LKHPKELAYQLALWRAPEVGAATFCKLQRAFPRLADLFNASHRDWEALRLKAPLIEYLSKPNWHGVENDIKWSEGKDCSIIGLNSSHYPRLLKEITSPPPLLFIRGDLQVLNQLQLAIVGSRKPTPWGKQIAGDFAKRLSNLGFCITSGLALGIDGASHQGALLAKKATLAVLGTGIDRIYPRQHQALAHQIAERGALLSLFPTGVPPDHTHFPRRNRLISGMSVGTLVVEATLGSGSLITARHAVNQGREVFAIPGSIASPQSAGCHALIQQGAKCVTKIEDILIELSQYGVASSNEEKLSKDKSKLAENDLIQQIGYEITSIETLITRTGLSFGAIMTKLLSLEMAGRIQSVSGGYIRVK